MNVTWMGLAEPSVERCRVEESRVGVRVESVIERADGTWSYALRADLSWRFERIEITDGDRALLVVRDAAGWHVGGSARTDLAAGREIDLSASPLSNTLPIRRLALAVGESADIVTAYIAIPELTVIPDPQRYTRQSADTWLYESRDSDFCRTITVDAAGLVVTYPGLFARG